MLRAFVSLSLYPQSWAATALGRMAAFLVIPQEMITVQDVGVNSSAYQTPLDAPVQQDSWESIVQQVLIII